MPLSTVEANKILDTFTGKSATYAKPTAFYLGLSTTTPTTAGGNINEPVGNGYARVQVLASEFATAVGGATSNNTIKSFPAATGAWGGGQPMTYGVFFDAATSGNFLGYAALPTPKTVSNGETPKVPSGDLDLVIA